MAALWPVALMFLACASPSVPAATTIDQPRFGYSLTLPEDWERIPGSAITNYLRALSLVTKGQATQERYDDGFQRSADGHWFQYPYILVQAKETGRVPEGQLARMKSLRSGVQTGLDSAERKMAAIASNLSLGDTYYDATNKCIWIHFSMTVANVGEIKALSCGFLTEKGMLLFHCYAPAAEYEDLLPTFNQILSSVQLTEGLRYKPRPGDSIGFDFTRIGRSGLIGGGIGGLIGVVIWLTKRLQSGKSSSAGPPPLPRA